MITVLPKKNIVSSIQVLVLSIIFTRMQSDIGQNGYMVTLIFLTFHLFLYVILFYIPNGFFSIFSFKQNIRYYYYPFYDF